MKAITEGRNSKYNCTVKVEKVVHRIIYEVGELV